MKHPINASGCAPLAPAVSWRRSETSAVALGAGGGEHTQGAEMVRGHTRQARSVAWALDKEITQCWEP